MGLGSTTRGEVHRPTIEELTLVAVDLIYNDIEERLLLITGRATSNRDSRSLSVVTNVRF